MVLVVLAVHWVIRLLIIALIARAVISWVAPMSRHPAVAALNQLTDPLLMPIRNAIGVQSGVDFSPLILIVILSLVDGVLFRLL